MGKALASRDSRPVNGLRGVETLPIMDLLKGAPGLIRKGEFVPPREAAIFLWL